MRVAIVGAGLMGFWHGAAARRLGATVDVVADPDLEKARQLASRLGAAAAVTDIQSTIHERGVDVAHLCSPASTHYPLAVELMSAGCDVLIEKPLANCFAETRDMLATAKSLGRLVTPVHQYLFQEGVQQTLKILASLGPLVHVEAVAFSAGAEIRALDPDLVASEILPHPLSLLCRVLGTRLAELEWGVARPARGELRAHTSDRGTSVSILMSMNGRPPRNTLTITGQRATVHLDLFHGYATVERSSISRTSKALRPFALSAATFAAAAANLARRIGRGESAYPGLRTLIGRFYDAVAGNRVPPIAFDEVLDVAAAREDIVAAAQALAATGQNMTQRQAVNVGYRRVVKPPTCPS